MSVPFEHTNVRPFGEKEHDISEKMGLNWSPGQEPSYIVHFRCYVKDAQYDLLKKQQQDPKTEA